VTPVARSHGPFGLPGYYGWGILGGIGIAIGGTLLYGLANRRRPKDLPLPEGWMKAGTEGRAGGVSADRAGSSAPRPPTGPP